MAIKYANDGSKKEYYPKITISKDYQEPISTPRPLNENIFYDYITDRKTGEQPLSVEPGALTPPINASDYFGLGGDNAIGIIIAGIVGLLLISILKR